MPAERIELIFETADRFPGRIAFDVSFRGSRYVDQRNAGTAERLKISADIEATARRNGYDFIVGKKDSDGEMIPIQRFVSKSHVSDPREIVDAFRDQGYYVICTSGYFAGRILTMDEITSMSRQDFDQAQREEAAYAAGRAAQRAGRDAAAILRLKAAALAEEAPETAQMSQRDREAIRAHQAKLRTEENGHEMPDVERSVGFAA